MRTNKGFTPLENEVTGNRSNNGVTMPIKLLLRKKLFTRRSLSGFTLIEILLVVLIIGILAGLVIPNMVGRGEEARREGAMADIHGGIGAALDLYELDTGTYPARLEDLITDPGSVKNWRGPYVKRRLPKDPWGNEYSYKYPGINNTASYDLSSRGSDGQEGTADDISNWDTD